MEELEEEKEINLVEKEVSINEKEENI